MSKAAIKREIDEIRRQIRPRRFNINLAYLSERDSQILDAAHEIMRRCDLEGRTTHIGDRVVIVGLTDDENTMLEAACIIIDHAQNVSEQRLH